MGHAVSRLPVRTMQAPLPKKASGDRGGSDLATNSPSASSKQPSRYSFMPSRK